MKATDAGFQHIKLRTDSEYVFHMQWIPLWRNNNWRKPTGDAVENLDLVKQFDLCWRMIHIHTEWVRGHSGDAENTEADRLASEGAKRYVG